MRAGLEVEHFQRIVAQRRDKQPLALEVHRQVVNPPLDMGQGNRLDQAEQGPLLGVRREGQDGQSKP
jgi:hypothetical protein